MGTDMTCDKCQCATEYVGSMTSGNSKYNLYKCKGCGAETMRCTGVLDRKQADFGR